MAIKAGSSATKTIFLSTMVFLPCKMCSGSRSLSAYHLPPPVPIKSLFITSLFSFTYSSPSHLLLDQLWLFWALPALLTAAVSCPYNMWLYRSSIQCNFGRDDISKTYLNMKTLLRPSPETLKHRERHQRPPCQVPGSWSTA